MAVFEQSQFIAVGLSIRKRIARWLAHHAVVVFVVLSAAFGPSIVMLHPPLRAPDEAAHFLRAYGIAQGDIVPSTVDGMGRKGIHLPASLAADFHFFEEVRHRVSARDIARGRREVTILDRQGLTEASCECYQLVRTRVVFTFPKHTRKK